MMEKKNTKLQKIVDKNIKEMWVMILRNITNAHNKLVLILFYS